MNAPKDALTLALQDSNTELASPVLNATKDVTLLAVLATNAEAVLPAIPATPAMNLLLAEAAKHATNLSLAKPAMNLSLAKLATNLNLAKNADPNLAVKVALTVQAVLFVKEFAKMDTEMLVATTLSVNTAISGLKLAMKETDFMTTAKK